MCLLGWGLNQAIHTAVQCAVFCMSYKLEALRFVGGTTQRLLLYLSPSGHSTERHSLWVILQCNSRSQKVPCMLAVTRQNGRKNVTSQSGTKCENWDCPKLADICIMSSLPKRWRRWALRDLHEKLSSSCARDQLQSLLFSPRDAKPWKESPFDPWFALTALPTLWDPGLQALFCARASLHSLGMCGTHTCGASLRQRLGLPQAMA